MDSIPSRAEWRKGGDLNPREACTPDGFRDRSIRPLWHPSVLEGYRLIIVILVEISLREVTQDWNRSEF